MSGLTSTGFTAKTIEEIAGEIEADLLSNVEPTLDLSPDQPMGQVVGICSQREALLWELLATAFNAFDPDQAENFLLDNVCAISGTKRTAAAPSKVSVTCNVNGGFLASARTVQINVAGQPETLFTNRDVIPVQTAGNHDFVFVSVADGPVVANSGTLTVITAPVSGLNSVTNALDAELGNFDETDADLRVKREAELAAPGACTVDAIRADALRIPGVKQAFVFENETMAVDGNGLPAKSFELVIYDGLTPTALDATVAQLVWDEKPSGAETYGTNTTTVKDAEGVDRTVKWSRATPRAVYLDFDLEVDVEHFPTDGIVAVKAAVAFLADQFLNLGVDVVSRRMSAFAMTIPGVIDITALRMGFSASPSGTANLAIGNREIASVDTSRIGVNVTPGIP